MRRYTPRASYYRPAEIGEAMPKEFRSLHRHVVAVDPSSRTAVRLPGTRGKKGPPDGWSVELWTTTDDGQVTDRIKAVCAFEGCRAALTADQARAWWKNHEHRDPAPPMFCCRECRGDYNRKPNKGQCDTRSNYLKTAFEGGDL